MSTIPDPLHPAVVHFPIVLILCGALLAVAAVFWHRWSLPFVAAGLLVLGAVGASVAVSTGESDEEMAGEAAGAPDALLDEHEDWAERTQVAAVIAGVLAVAAAAVLRWPIVRRFVASAAAVGALVASWCVYETGHRGGRLVYQHGLGVLAAGNVDRAAAGEPATVHRAHDRDDDDDD